MVTDGVTGAPVAGASVFLSGVVRAVDSRVTSTVTRPIVLTDARGRFVFTDLPSTHSYSLFASRPGSGGGEYEGPSSANNKMSTGDGLSIRIAEGEWMRNASISLRRAATIAGRVIDERGEPIVGAAVRVFVRRMVSGYQYLVQGAVTSTDDRGAYRFRYLDPGQYFVAVLSVQATVPASVADGARRLPLGGLEGRGMSSVSRPEVIGASIDVDGRHRLVITNFATPPPPSGDRPRAYTPVFHPNARTIDEAQAVELEVGISRADIDFQLAPVNTVRIAGRVTGVVRDTTNMLLRIMPRGGEHLGFGSAIATTLVEADGSFTFLNVPAGEYKEDSGSAGGGGSAVSRSLPVASRPRA